jgi:hypothetical protein
MLLGGRLPIPLLRSRRYASKWIVFEHAVTKSPDHGPMQIVAL